MRRIAAATDGQGSGSENRQSSPAVNVQTRAQPSPSVQPVANIQPQAVPSQTLPLQATPQAHIQPVQQAAVPVQVAQAAPTPVEQIKTPEPDIVPPVVEQVLSFRPKPSTASKEDTSEERPPIGFLISCDGVNAIIQANSAQSVEDVSVGQMIAMTLDNSRIIGLVFKLDQVTGTTANENIIRIHVELQGEIRQKANGEIKFHKGIASYPAIGTVATCIQPNDLAILYAASGSRNVVIGSLAQEQSIPAFIDVENMLSKHFAVLGSTGCGKSSAVSLLMRATQEVVPDLRTLVLDPHNEYSCAFEEANTLDATGLDIPFWMFQLEEFAEVLYRGKPKSDDEMEALREIIPEARQRYKEGEDRMSLRNDGSSSSMTADSPVPYRVSDVLAILDEELGLLDARFSRSVLKSVKSRISALVNDARYRFMFRDRTISDRAEEVLERFFNLSGEGHLMTILQTSGLPSEVVNSVASVLCRLSFELCIAAKGTLKLLVVCEEAHRYVPADMDAGFEPTRRAIARIAKEGRKYGVFLGIISQRPAELDPTILSQCSTVFSLRMSNEHDQTLIRKAISSSSQSTISFLSSLANREAIAFGEGLSTPMRLRFHDLPEQWLPGRDRNVFQEVALQDLAQNGHRVFKNWRGVVGLAPTNRPVA